MIMYKNHHTVFKGSTKDIPYTIYTHNKWQVGSAVSRLWITSNSTYLNMKFLDTVQQSLFDGIKKYFLNTNNCLLHDYGSERALASRTQNQDCVQRRV